MMAVYYEHELLSNSYNVFFIDNMSVLCAAVLGHSSHVDMSSLLFALNLRLTDIRCNPWWEYVPSASNIADGGSRIGVCDKVAADAGILLEQKEFPAWPTNFMSMRLSEWRNFWL